LNGHAETSFKLKQNIQPEINIDTPNVLQKCKLVKQWPHLEPQGKILVSRYEAKVIMIVRFRGLEAPVMPHLLLPTLSFDFHHLPNKLFYIISHFIAINMPTRYAPSKIRDKSPDSPELDISSRLLAFSPSQAAGFLFTLNRGLLLSFAFLLSIFHFEIFKCLFLFGLHYS
jgi:hypothetical protein